MREYPTGEELKFELLTIGKYSREAELIKSQLKEVGIEIGVKVMDWSTMDAILKEGNFFIAINGHGGIANPRILKAPDWPASTFHDDDYDSTFKAQEKTMIVTARKELVDHLQEIIADDLPVYTLYHPKMCCVYRPEKLDTWFFTKGGVGIGIPIEMNKLVFISEEAVSTPVPTMTVAPTATPSPSPTSAPEQPGFEAVFAIAGLLAVAYRVLRRKN